MSRVICVDLDGTLVRSDLLIESFLQSWRRAPTMAADAMVRLGKNGKAAFKRRLAEGGGAHIAVENLPYDPEVLAYLEKEKAAGAKIELISGSDQSIIDRIAGHLGIFDAAYGSDGERNLTAERKAAFLQERHPDGFVYIGNSSADRAPWKAASEALSANAPKKLVSGMRKDGVDVQEISKSPSLGRALVKGMRLHQWCKNALLFTIFLLTFADRNLEDFLLLCGAFVAFGLVASATYLLNDMLDIEADRAHPTKRRRPFASGALPIEHGALLIGVILLAGVVVASLIGQAFLICLIGYTALTVAYSFKLKTVAVLDVLILGFLFCLRIIAGGATIDVEISHWLMVFSLLFFSSLAFAKRYVELLKKAGQADQAVAGRGYVHGDSQFVLTFGGALAVAALLVFLLYSFSGENAALSQVEMALGCLGVISYWIMRVWFLTARGQMLDDPVLFAVKDKVSYLLGAIMVLALAIDHWAQ